MPAALWRIQIEKELGTEQWSNDYLTSDLILDDAQDLASGLLAWEKAIHTVDVNFVFVLISSTTVGDRVFRHITVNEPGTLASSDYIPLFNTMRIDLGTSDSDPARKYYRCPIKESDISNGRFTSGHIGTINGFITTYLETPGLLGHIVTSKGNTVVEATVQPAVQMRQLHRRRLKKVVE